jgi:hypothetical protein
VGAKIKRCKKGYEDIEFNSNDVCPISGSRYCNECKVDGFVTEISKKENE